MIAVNKFFLPLLFVGAIASAAPIHKTVGVKTVIIGNHDSDALKIIADKYVFAAVYQDEKGTFGDVNIPFSLASPKEAIAEEYAITLSESKHQCNPIAVSHDASRYVENVEPLFVDFFLDGELMQKGDEGENTPFQTVDDDGTRWSRHLIRLSYPAISQKSYKQDCSGIVAIEVSLVI
ncbi:hypothetical protein F9L16_17625 [Agarivorans sp. B2Z047]|uniref:hypothetical protein n=1 Tax=Agarivorans sp. B2Z047 TaxID=2652721 RepID=UPI00128AF6F6|nr:hypothetical protein [Agarivorans sp. B2Z047]MPW30809.1 hypothetical protein [Agarivorans sp. B2Z047]UQN40961.1 hypothetical protein LQZ07_14385 [Agarivorans sp. B2Z047]